MSIDEILKKTSIEFPLPIDKTGTENLLSYIAKNLPGNVSSRIDYFKNFIYDPEKKMC